MDIDAYMMGYLVSKEAKDSWWENTKRGAKALWSPLDTASDLYTGAKAGIGNTVDDVQRKVTNKLTGTTPGQRHQMKQFIANPQKKIEEMATPFVNKLENKAKGYMGLMGAGFLGTQLMNNMSANRRHQEMMKVLKNIGGKGGNLRTPAQYQLRS